MYLILNNNNVIIHISETIGYQSNGNVLVDNSTLAIAKVLVKEVVEVEQVAENVEPMKYCYVNGAFEPNPNWKEPAVPVSELLSRIEMLENMNSENQALINTLLGVTNNEG